MKNIKLTIIAFFVFALNANAQAKPIDKAVIIVPGLHCDLDKDKIERTLMRADGIGKYKVDVKRKTVAVTVIKDRITIENVRYLIANMGYDADKVKAEETTQSKLPPACKPVPVVVPAKPVVVEPAPVKKVAVVKPVTAPAKKAVTPAVKVVPKKN